MRNSRAVQKSFNNGIVLMHMHACQRCCIQLNTLAAVAATHAEDFTEDAHPPDVCVLRGSQQERAPRVKRLCFQLLYLPQIPSMCNLTSHSDSWAEAHSGLLKSAADI